MIYPFGINTSPLSSRFARSQTNSLMLVSITTHLGKNFTFIYIYIYNTCRVFYKPTPEHTVLKIRFRHMFAFIYYNTCKNVTKPTSLTHYKKAPVGSFFYIYILYILAKFCTNRFPVPSIILLPNK